MRNIRPSDIVEMEMLAQATGRTLNLAAHHADLCLEVKAQRVWTMLIDGKVAAVFGVAPDNVIWLQGTDASLQHWRLFTRTCRKLVKFFEARHGVLMNVVPKALGQRHRWLKHIGFDLLENEAQLQSRGLVPFMSRPNGPEG